MVNQPDGALPNRKNSDAEDPVADQPEQDAPPAPPLEDQSEDQSAAAFAHSGKASNGDSQQHPDTPVGAAKSHGGESSASEYGDSHYAESYHDDYQAGYHGDQHDTEQYHDGHNGGDSGDSPSSDHGGNYRHPVRWDDGGAEDDDEGGPVKPFLEHLEDLRWVMVKSIVAVIFGMVVCLVGAKQAVAILTQPIDKANIRLAEVEAKKNRAGVGEYEVYIQSGADYHRTLLSTNWLGGFDLGTNRVWTFRPVPVQIGTNLVITLQGEPNPPPGKAEAKGNLINLGPLEGFKVALQVAIFGGIGLASPFIFYFVGTFIFPALKRNEKKHLFRAIGLGAVLFCCGILFCYFVVIPIVLMAAVNFSHWLNFGADQWRASEYIGVVSKFMLGMGLGFELPIVILTLVKLDLLDYAKLNKYRPYWVVVNLVLSSVLTPPDPISMLLMALPLHVLYEFSVFISWLWERKARREALNAA